MCVRARSIASTHTHCVSQRCFAAPAPCYCRWGSVGPLCADPSCSLHAVRVVVILLSPFLPFSFLPSHLPPLQRPKHRIHSSSPFFFSFLSSSPYRFPLLSSLSFPLISSSLPSRWCRDTLLLCSSSVLRPVLWCNGCPRLHWKLRRFRVHIHMRLQRHCMLVLQCVCLAVCFRSSPPHLSPSSSHSH